MTKKRYVVKITPLVPGTPKYVDVNTINRNSAEFVALQILKERGQSMGYYKSQVTEVK